MGNKTIEENVYDADRRLTQIIVRRVQALLRDPKLQKVKLRRCAGIKEVESIVERRAHGEFPTPLHEIVALDQVIDSDLPIEAKTWARQRAKILRRRIK